MSSDIPDDEIPEAFLCPITQQAFKDPVMDMHGRTYERNAILSWLAANGTCPLTRRTMKASDLIPNIMMQTRVRLWQRETGQKVCPTKLWGGAGILEDVLGSVEDPTETESGSDTDIDCFMHTPVYAITITPVDRRHQSRHSRHSGSSSRRRHHNRGERNRPVEEPTPSVASPRRFRLFGRRGSL
jgi:hypothetical protein